jgi:Ca-activated chloride channel family protein
MGGTAIDDALRKALALRPGGEDRPFVVIFLTDGRPTIGTTDEDQIVGNVKKENEGHTRVFCFGIGTDVNTHLLDRITEQTRAASQYVLPEEDLEVKVSNFFAKIKEPVLANPTLKFTGGIRTTKLYPSPLPDLFKGEQLVLVGRYSGRGDSAVVVEGTVNGAERKFTYEVSFAGEEAANDFIPRLWATRRVGYLLDEIRLRGENAELRDEVTDLARRYGIVTPYTAYLILEDETQRNVPVRMRSLHGFDDGGTVRRQAAQAWNEFKGERSGGVAVASARYGMALKSADAVAPAAASGALEARRALGLPATPSPQPAASAADRSKERLAQFAQQAQFVAGKSFYRNDNQWVDAAVQKHPQAKRVRIQFGSAEYFDLAGKHAEALPWLALGQNVQFVLEGTVYEIHE